MTITGSPFGIKLCEILKLDSHKTRTITISVVPNDIVYVNVGQTLQQDEADKLLELVKHYKLIPDDLNDEIRIL